MLSSTTLPTAIARPDRLIKFRDKSAAPMTRIPVMMLSGMETPMMAVGRRVMARPRNKVGRVLIKKMNTALRAKKNPSIPSLSKPESCSSTSGPSFCRINISTSGGSPTSRSRAARACSVTSTVLASGSFKTTTPRLGLPLVREMLVAWAVPSSTSATSFSSTRRSPRRPATGTTPKAETPSKPMVRLRMSSREPNS